MEQEKAKNPLRVMVILPFYGGSLPVGRYAATALRDLGHTVDVFESPSFFATFSALRGLRLSIDRFERLEHSFLQLIAQAIRARAESFEPDLLLFLAQAPVTRQLIQAFRREKIPTAMWFVEDYNVFAYWRAIAPLFDFFFVIQKEPFLSELAKIGATAKYLPMAALPSFHHPITELSAVERVRYGSDLSFVGAGYPNRRLAFRQLTQFDFKIWGSDWDDEVLLSSCLQKNGMRIDPEEAVKIFNASKINLNLHSSIRTQELVPNGDFVNPRTFELAACGAFQLVNQRELLPELFEPDELATFTTMPELLEKITYYLTHNEERQQIAEKSRARVLAQHTYQHRMASMLDFIHEQRPDWPKPRSEMELPKNLPEDLRQELGNLLHHLELRADSTFEDVIIRLRQQKGVLSPLETSLLFLDEWRKQYRK